MNGHGREDRANWRWLRGFFAGFLSGSLVGAVAMLLLAPRTGKGTRSQIQQQGMKLRDQAAESIEDVLAEAGDKAHQFKDGVHKEVEEVQQRAQDIVRGAK